MFKGRAPIEAMEAFPMVNPINVATQAAVQPPTWHTEPPTPKPGPTPPPLPKPRITPPPLPERHPLPPLPGPGINADIVELSSAAKALSQK